MTSENLTGVCMALEHASAKARLMVAALKTSRTEARAFDTQPLTELDAMLTSDERRTVSVNDHHHFQRSLEVDDDFDRELDDDMIEVSWPEANPPSRRSDKELSKLLGILDSLEGGRA